MLDRLLDGGRIRPWRLADRFSLVRHAADPTVSSQMMALFPYPYTENDAQVWLAWVGKTEGVHHFAIEVGGFAVGGVGLVMGHGLYAQTADLGYWLNHRYRGRGLARQAVQALLQHGFENLPVRRIGAYVFAGNLSSLKLLGDLGFQREGCMREVLVRGTSFIDLEVWSMLKSEFRP